MQNTLIKSLNGGLLKNSDFSEKFALKKRSKKAGNEKPIERSFGLDLARTLAICLVIFSHFANKRLDSLGFWGVELFFGLSGFLIGQILWKNFLRAEEWKFRNLSNFWARRWWRTLPNYYLFLFLTLIFTFVAGESLPTISALSRFLWFGQDLFNGQYGFFPVSWSLCIEEWFYLLFPLVLFLLAKTRLKAQTTFLLTLGIFFFASFIVREILASDSPETVIRITTLARLDAIASGVTVAFFCLVMNPTIWLRRLSFLAGSLLCMIPLINMYWYDNTYEKIIQDPLFLFITPMGFSLMLPWISMMKSPKATFKPFATAVRKLSLWSYSIYLSHLPIMWIVYSICSGFRNNTYGNLLSKILGLIITITCSALLFRYFEEPLTKKRPAAIRS